MKGCGFRLCDCPTASLRALKRKNQQNHTRTHTSYLRRALKISLLAGVSASTTSAPLSLSPPPRRPPLRHRTRPREVRARHSFFSAMSVPSVLVFVATAAAQSATRYETRWYEQTLDHFGFHNTSATWQHRYLYNDTFWGVRGPLPNQCRGPILFYTGNEGPITAFHASNGFMTEVLAPAFGALLIFAEERYYGASLPQGTSGRYDFLTTEQVLADYASLVGSLRAQLGAESCPVIAFGGSYGGTLTTLFRLKYPHMVAGGLASSAPLGYYALSGWEARNVTMTTWFEIVQRTFNAARPGCYDELASAVEVANATASSGGGPKVIQQIFGLCAPPGDLDAFVYWLTEALESIPQVDYPEATGGLPANPVRAVCSLPTLGSSPLKALATVMEWYYGKGPSGCIPNAINDQVDGGTPGDGPANNSAWGYQSCTETLHPFSTPAGAWRDYQFNLTALRELCQAYYGVSPRLGWLEMWSGGYAIATDNLTSNLIWSNGRFDPWSGGGFLRSEDAVPGGAVFVMEQTAHHQDLRAPSAADPPELVEVRKQEFTIIRSWIMQAGAQHRS